MSKNSTWESTVKPVVVLSVIALIVSLLLALVNSFTAPIIEENLKAATLAAYVDVMPTVSSASDLDEVTDFSTENVTGVVKATDGSIAIKAEEKGFDGGILSVIMGFDTNGTVTGIWVDASTDQGHRQQCRNGQLPGAVRRHGRHPEHHPGPGLRRLQRRYDLFQGSVCCHQ